MIFVSKYRDYTVVIDPGKSAWRAAGPGGRMVEYEEFPELVARFHQGDLNPRVLNAAMRLLWVGDRPFGAMLSTVSGVIDSGESEAGQAYEAADPRWRLSGFNTEDTARVPPEHREYVEERMLTRECGFGTDYVLVDAGGFEKPWPAYDKIGQGAAQKIPSMTKELGLDARDVIEYERNKKNRPGVIEALTALIDESREREENNAPILAIIE